MLGGSAGVGDGREVSATSRRSPGYGGIFGGLGTVTEALAGAGRRGFKDSKDHKDHDSDSNRWKSMRMRWLSLL
jgi:hypothetical protein